ncbi:MAG: ATP-binding protein [Terriglobia bacterium]
MTGWLLRSEHIRSVDLVAEFLRTAARVPATEEGLRHACDTLRQLFGADAVLLWKLDPTGQRLEVVAASPPEWEVMGELALDALPDWREALADAAPLWGEEVATRWHPLPAPLLEAHSALLVPVVTPRGPQGCLLSVFTRAVNPPPPEEREAGQTLAHVLGLMLEAQSLRQQCEAGEILRPREALQRLERELQRRGLSESSLEALAAAARELSHAEAAGLYERQPSGFRRLAAAGAAHLLPSELPLGESKEFPWQRARAKSRPLEVNPAELTHVLQPWLPQVARSDLRLRVLAFETGDAPLGALLMCGFEPGAPRGGKSEEFDWTEFSLLATAQLENRRRRCREEHYQRRYQFLFDQLQEGAFYLDAAGRLGSVNSRLSDWLGYAPDELEGQALASFLRPEDAEALSAWLRAGSPPAFRAEVRWRVKRGGWWPCELTLRRVPESGAAEPLRLGFVRDTTRERETGYRYCLNEARLQGLLDSIRDGVWLIAADGTVQAANQRLGQLFGVKPRELGPGVDQRQALSRLRSQFRSPDAVVARWEQLHRNPQEVCWDELVLVAPRWRVLERFARPLFDRQQRLVGRLEIYRDITPQRLLEEKVMRRERLAAVGQLISGIAHELNNPLTAVTGNAQLLLSGPLPGALREKAERLAQEADRAGRIVKNLLHFARGDKGEKESVDLGELLERTLSLRAYELRVENIQVVRDYPRELPRILSDPGQLQQVFLNILLNAEQAIRSQRDHGRVTVRIHSQPDPARVRVEFSDTGPGIPLAVLPHIFDPFFTTKPPQGGTGLGLSISQAIVKEHGGEILVHSSPGQGATFIVDLPAQPQPRPRPPARRASAKKESARILVVDDEPAVAQLIADALEQQGYVVHVYTDSRRALAEALQQPFGLAICDVRMPEVDGQAFHRTLREQHSALAHRLLFTTGDTLARETADFLEKGCLPYLAKPFRIEQLQKVVRELLQAWDTSVPAVDPASAD